MGALTANEQHLAILFKDECHPNSRIVHFHSNVIDFLIISSEFYLKTLDINVTLGFMIHLELR